MRKWTLLVLGMMAVSLAFAEPGEAENAEKPPVVAMVAIGDVDAPVFERVRSFVVDQYTIPVNVVTSAESAETLAEAVETAQALLEPNHLFILGLVSPTGDDSAHGVFFPDRKVAIVNVKSLKETAEDEERYGRRLERQSMRSIAMLFGMGPCPNPHCALCSYKDDAEMDQMGRGLCPPCLHKVKQTAEERGVELIEKPVPAFIR